LIWCSIVKEEFVEVWAIRLQ